MVAEMMRLRQAGQGAEPVPLPSHLDLTYSVSQAATVLRCRVGRIHRLIGDGTLPAVQIAERWRVDAGRVDALAAQSNRPAEPTIAQFAERLERVERLLAGMAGVLTAQEGSQGHA